jgi:hypothetical protein
MYRPCGNSAASSTPITQYPWRSGPQLFSMQPCSSLSTLSRSTDPLWCGASRKQNAEQLRVRSPRERRPCLYTTFGVLLPLLGRSSIGFVCEMGEHVVRLDGKIHKRLRRSSHFFATHAFNTHGSLDGWLTANRKPSISKTRFSSCAGSGLNL